MSTTEQRRTQLAKEHVDAAERLLLRAHALSKTLEFAISGVESKHEQMKDSIQFSAFITSIEHVNDAVHEAIAAALEEVDSIQRNLPGEDVQ